MNEDVRPTLVIIDLDLANAEMLWAANTHNRNLNRRFVRVLADDLLTGRYQYCGDTIKVSIDGVLLDGQHRIAALMLANEESDHPITMRIGLATGLPAETQDVMDVGMKRRTADQLALAGFKYSKTMAAAETLIQFFEGGDLANRKFSFSMAKLTASAKSRPALQDACELAHDRMGKDRLFSVSAVAAAMYLIRRECVDDDAVHLFFERVLGGVDLQVGDPVLALRNRVMTMKMNREHVRNNIELTMLLRAWNAHRKGQSMHKFPIRDRMGTLFNVDNIQG